MPKKYSPKVKFQVVKEVLSSDKSVAQIAREYDIHPNTIHKWEETFEENGPEVFGDSDQIKEYEKKISDYERLVGKKEREIAILKNFLGNLD